MNTITGWAIFAALEAGKILECQTESTHLRVGERYLHGGYFRSITGVRCLASVDEVLHASWREVQL